MPILNMLKDGEAIETRSRAKIQGSLGCLECIATRNLSSLVLLVWA